MNEEKVEQITHAKVLKITAFFVGAFIVGVVFYHFVEDLSYVDALYFTATTITTVGYGDIAPQTDAGKIFTVFYAFLGIGMFFGFANIIFQSTMQKRFLRRKSEEDK